MFIRKLYIYQVMKVVFAMQQVVVLVHSQCCQGIHLLLGGL